MTPTSYIFIGSSSTSLRVSVYSLACMGCLRPHVLLLALFTTLVVPRDNPKCNVPSVYTCSTHSRLADGPLSEIYGSIANVTHWHFFRPFVKIEWLVVIHLSLAWISVGLPHCFLCLPIYIYLDSGIQPKCFLVLVWLWTIFWKSITFATYPKIIMLSWFL